MYRDTPFSLHPGTVYQVQQGLFSSLIVFELRHPEGSDPSGPSPFCSSLTPAADTEVARLRHTAGQISNTESAVQSMDVALGQLQVASVTSEDLRAKADEGITATWKILLDESLAQISGRLIPRLSALYQEELASEVELESLGGLAEGMAVEPILDDGIGRYSRLHNPPLEALPSDLLDLSGRVPTVKSCVGNIRGGAEARFTFRIGQLLPFEDFLFSGALNDVDGIAQMEAGSDGTMLPRKLLGQSWEGYPQISARRTVAQTEDADGWKWGARRLVGLYGNQVLTGAQLVQTRHPPRSQAVGGAKYERACRPAGLAQKLAAECDQTRTRSASQKTAEIAAQERNGDILGGVPSIGVDPAFVSSSTLFNPQVALYPLGWYNTSSARQVNREGVPYGFHPHPVPGLPENSYPLILDINVKAERAHEMMRYLVQGAFLDRFATKSLQLKVGTYSVTRQLYGYSVVTANWDEGGRIHADLNVETLEFRDFSPEGLDTPGMPNRLATDIVLLILILLYPVLQVRDIIYSLRAQQRRARVWYELHRIKRPAAGSLQEAASKSDLGNSTSLETTKSVLKLLEGRPGILGSKSATDLAAAAVCTKLGDGAMFERPTWVSFSRKSRAHLNRLPTAPEPPSLASQPSLGPSQPSVEAVDPAHPSSLSPRRSLSSPSGSLHPSDDEKGHSRDGLAHSDRSSCVSDTGLGSQSLVMSKASIKVPPAKGSRSNHLHCDKRIQEPHQQWQQQQQQQQQAAEGGVDPWKEVARTTKGSGPGPVAEASYGWHGQLRYVSEPLPGTLAWPPAHEQAAFHGPVMGVPGAHRHHLHHNQRSFPQQHASVSFDFASSEIRPQAPPARQHFRSGPGPVAEGTIEQGGMTNSSSLRFGSMRRGSALGTAFGAASFERGRASLTGERASFRRGSSRGGAYWRGSFAGALSDDSSSTASEGSVILDYDDTVVDDHPVPGKEKGKRKLKVMRSSKIQRDTAAALAVLKGMDECDVAVELKAPRRKEQGDEPDTETEDEDEMCEEEEEAELRGRRHGLKRHILTAPPRVYRGTSAPWWIPYEVITIVLMMVAAALLFYYTCYLQPQTAPTERRYQVYDSLYSPANPFMLKVEVPKQSTSEGVSNGQADGFQSLEPGEMQRWRAGMESKEGLRKVAEMYRAMDEMAAVLMAYGLIQGGVLVLIMIRLINHTAFQPVLSIVAGTLAGALEDMIFFAFVITIAALMVSMMMVILFGAIEPDLSSTSAAMMAVFVGITQGAATDSDSDEEIMRFLAKETQGGFDTNAASIFLAWILLTLRPLLYRGLLVMITSMLSYPYAELRMGAKGCPSVPRDITTLLRWQWASSTRGTPTNREMDKLLDKLLKLRPQPPPLAPGWRWKQAASLIRQAKLQQPSTTSPGTQELAPPSSTSALFLRSSTRNFKGSLRVSGRRIDDSSLDAILQHVAPPSTKPSGPQQQQAASPSEQSLHGRLSSNLSQRPSGERQHNWQARRRMQSSVLQVISGLRALKEQENSSSNSINGAGRGSSSNMEAGTGAGPVAGGMADLSAEDASRPAVQHARERLMQVLQARHVVNQAKLSKRKQEVRRLETHRVFGTAGALSSSYKPGVMFSQGAQHTALDAVPENCGLDDASSESQHFASTLSAAAKGTQAQKSLSKAGPHNGSSSHPLGSNQGSGAGKGMSMQTSMEHSSSGSSGSYSHSTPLFASTPSPSLRITPTGESCAQVASGHGRASGQEKSCTHSRQPRLEGEAGAAGASGEVLTQAASTQTQASEKQAMEEAGQPWLPLPTFFLSQKLLRRSMHPVHKDPMEVLLQQWEKALAGNGGVGAPDSNRSSLGLVQHIAVLMQEAQDAIAAIRTAIHETQDLAKALQSALHLSPGHSLGLEGRNQAAVLLNAPVPEPRRAAAEDGCPGLPVASEGPVTGLGTARPAHILARNIQEHVSKPTQQVAQSVEGAAESSRAQSSTAVPTLPSSGVPPEAVQQQQQHQQRLQITGAQSAGAAAKQEQGRGEAEAALHDLQGLRAYSTFSYSEVSELGVRDAEGTDSGTEGQDAEEEKGEVTQLQALAGLRAASKAAAALVAMRPALAAAQTAQKGHDGDAGPSDSPARPKKVAKHAKFADVEDSDDETPQPATRPAQSRPGSFSARVTFRELEGNHGRPGSFSSRVAGPAVASRAASYSAGRPGTGGDDEGPVKRRGWKMRRRYMEAHDLALEERSRPATAAHSFTSQRAAKSFTVRKGNAAVSSEWC
uniref:Polycystin cation channel PKD1/PKD2 domain-containing protein n=1 Tax=Dunaliella tertiolecta TaxID=3047 RepID=A0A7S3VUB8_DUNTE